MGINQNLEEAGVPSQHRNARSRMICRPRAEASARTLWFESVRAILVGNAGLSMSVTVNYAVKLTWCQRCHVE